MTKSGPCICALLPLLFPLFALANGDSLTQKTYTFKNLADTSLQLTVFSRPAPAAGLRPAIVLFHGGGWIKGSRQVMFPICAYFAERGIVAISASYRLLREGGGAQASDKSVCIADAKSAVRWVRLHAAELGIDTARIVLGGGSAGGHLATMAALDKKINDPLDDTRISTEAAALVLFNPAYIPNDAPGMQPFGLLPARRLPTIQFYGTNDPLRKTGRMIADGLVNQGSPAEIWYAPGQKHAFFNAADWRLAVCQRADTFLTTLGFLAPPKTALIAPADAQLVSRDGSD